MTFLSLLNLYKHAWLRVYTQDESGNLKESNVCYEFDQYNCGSSEGFVVVAHHLKEEPKCKQCPHNNTGENPCTCVSTYMHDRCMAKKFHWEHPSVEEVYCVFARLAKYEDEIREFSFEGVTESFGRFRPIFENANDPVSFDMLSDYVKNDQRIIKFKNDGKILKLILD